VIRSRFVQKKAIDQYNKSILVSNKDYPSLELVRLEKKFFQNPKGKLLEYGFGSGCNTLHLLKKNYNVVALDVASNAIKKFKKKNKKYKNISYVLLDPKLKKLPFKTETFDYIVAMSVLSLLGTKKRVVATLKEFDRILKLNGKIILDINGINSDVSNKKHIKNKQNLTYVIDDYIKTYCVKSKSEFKEIVKPYFKIVDIGYSKHSLFRSTISEYIICCEKKT
jgi:ubiquinone/menaquinone biosynthesis C-methylase UbiE